MSASYKTYDPRGWGGDPQRGAAIGRAPISDPEPRTFLTTLTLKQVPLDSGGYDPNGTYFGTGQNLYWLASDDSKIDRVFRARDGEHALAIAKILYPKAKLPDVVTGLAVDVAGIELDAFTQNYLECVLWAELDHADERGGEPLDANYTVEDFAPEFLAQAKKDCAAFQKANAATLKSAYSMRGAGYSDARAGHDFWLTRNRHGAGFRDRYLGEAGALLDEAARAFSEVDVYVGDDGKLHG